MSRRQTTWSPKKSPACEKRIIDEIVVDAYDEWERAMGWYYYLEEKLKFPFQAKCTVQRVTSPLKTDEVVEVIGMPTEEDCASDMFVKIRWQERTLAVPLSQLKAVRVDGTTRQAVGDWHYWVRWGYQF